MATGIPVAPGAIVECADYLNEVARAHWRKVTPKTVVNTITETDLLNGEITIDAGAMSTQRLLRLTAWGDLINNSGATQASPRWKLKLGGTVLLDTNTIAAVWQTATSRWGWRVRAEIHNLTAATQWAYLQAEFSGSLVPNLNAAFATGEGVIGTNGNSQAHGYAGASAAIDTTVARALALTVINPAANANLDVTLKAAIVEVV
jgi:hypothetical protein